MKKLWKILLPACLLCLCILLLPTKAHAASESDLTFKLNDDGNSYYVSGCSESASGELVIPATYNGKPVTSIGSWAFFCCENLTNITIPDSVTSIDHSAFNSCSSLTSITIPNSVTNIGSSAFFCCESLTNITIPDSVTNIENGTFMYCRGLISVTIPGSVTSIGIYAFCYCDSLTSITIPNSVTSIGNYAFEDCSSLTGIWVDENNPNYSSDTYGVLFNKEKTELIQAPGAIVEYVIPDGVTNIGSSSFSSCSNLTSITIPDSVTSIGDSAFSSCSSLTSIAIPDSVTSIGDSAFSSCSSLTSIAIPDSVTSIDDSAFLYCSGLTSVTIGDGVTSIGNSAFYNCSSLTSITIPDSVTSIGKGAFDGCDNLQYNAYDNAKYLGNENNPYVVLMNTVSTDITTCEIHPDTKIIYHYAFYGCWNLSSITIPDSVISIGYRAFYSCIIQTGIWVDEENLNYSSDTYGALFNKVKTELIWAPKMLTEYVIPDGVTSIDNDVFQNFTSLTSIAIPDSVTSIGDYAFLYCSGLTSVTIGDGVTSIDDYAFSHCSSITSITIPDSVTSINYCAFYHCDSLTSITIPDSVTYIDSSAFSRCSSLTGMWVSENNPNYSNDSYGVLFNKEKTELNQAPGAITEYIIPNSVTSISGDAFLGCDRLTSITIPDSVTWTGWSAFRGCESLTSVTIGNGLTSINGSMFSNCSSLTSINIPDSVTSIGDYAFYDCSSLTGITIPDSVTSINWNAFSNCSNLTDVYYTGTQAQWESISIDSGNDDLTNATIHYGTADADACIGKYNIALGDDLCVKFYLLAGDRDSSELEASVKIGNGNEKIFPLSELTQQDGYWILPVHMSAAQMSTSITVKLTSGETLLNSGVYTVRSYCDTLLADESQTAYHGLIKEMLNYGAAAQAFFGYESDGMANEGITGAGQTAVPERAPEMSVSGKAGSVRFYGASLVYESKIAVRFYFSGDVSGCKFSVGEQTYTPVAKNGLYYIEVSDILPQNLDETIAVTVAFGQDTLTASYSPLTYLVRMNAKGTETLQDLMRALYNYHLAAKALNDL